MGRVAYPAAVNIEEKGPVDGYFRRRHHPMLDLHTGPIMFASARALILSVRRRGADKADA